jgi:hypothetical protein
LRSAEALLDPTALCAALKRRSSTVVLAAVESCQFKCNFNGDRQEVFVPHESGEDGIDICGGVLG